MKLTERQRQIVELLSQGLSNKEISRVLGIAAGTVKVHLYEMYQRFEVNSRGKLINKLRNIELGGERQNG